jgi:hypothetical protein|tara:strand:- start:184 stop:309 length:126 start_codon:yes stop_codon:yes gene_type:complete
MSKNTAKQIYNQTVEWLKVRGIDIKKRGTKRSKFNKFKKNK